MITNGKNKQSLEIDAQNQQNNATSSQHGQWKNQLDDTIDKILNREQFSYDMDSDAMYEQMKDQYIRQGQMAMMDTMGKAATMTGGYGNSYAQGVGQQTYQEYLQGFNDEIPELYQMALDAYTREGQALSDKYAVLSDKRGDELEAAELAASLGDYSLLAKYYGWTDDYMDGLVNPEKESSYNGGGPGGGDTIRPGMQNHINYITQMLEANRYKDAENLIAVLNQAGTMNKTEQQMLVDVFAKYGY